MKNNTNLSGRWNSETAAVGRATSSMAMVVRVSTTAKGILTQHISSHNYTLIPFREKFHDAIELGHTYDIRCEQLSGESTKTVKEYGYLALIKARRNTSLAKKAYIELQVICYTLKMFRLAEFMTELGREFQVRGASQKNEK